MEEKQREQLLDTETVFAFVAEFWGVDRSRLRENTTLFGDLGIDGDDGHELFLEFSRRFDVDLSTLDMSRHFGPEATGCLPVTLFHWIYIAYLRHRYGMSEEESCGLVAVTIADLIASADAGRWCGTIAEGRVNAPNLPRQA